MPDDHQQAVRELVNQWMRRARADLAVTELIDDQRLAPEIVAFHAQQAVEKALKALLVLRQVDFPRTHDLGTLLRLCDAAGYSGIADISDIVTLTRYAVASRYPGETDAVEHDDAQVAADRATQVLAWVETWIAKE